MQFDTVEDAIHEFKAGRMIVLVDDDHGYSGDLVMAAETVTSDAINFMAMHGRGLICLSMTPERIDQLDLPRVHHLGDDRHVELLAGRLEDLQAVLAEPLEAVRAGPGLEGPAPQAGPVA